MVVMATRRVTQTRVVSACHGADDCARVMMMVRMITLAMRVLVLMVTV